MNEKFTRSWRPSEGSMQTALGSETVLMHEETGSYFGLDEVGSRIWELLGRGIPPVEIGPLLANEYAVPEEEASGDVLRFVEALVERGLIIPG